MRTPLFIGMDLHKKTTTFVVKDERGTLIDRKNVPTEPPAVTSYLAAYRTAALVMEPVTQWYFYADHIQRLGITVHIAHPLKIKEFARRRVKTDLIDAHLLCDLLRTGLLRTREAYFAPREVRRWKELVRLYATLVRLRTKVKNEVRAMLAKNALHSPFSKLFSVSGRRWLDALTLDDQFAVGLASYRALAETLDGLIKESEARIRRTAADNPQCQLLMSVPGIGPYFALTIMSEVGEIGRFRSPRKLMRYARVVPEVHSSGGKTYIGHISKRGSARLKNALVQAAMLQARCRRRQGFGSYYASTKRRKGTRTAAVATARKLAAVIWRILRDKRPFEALPPACPEAH